MKKDVSGARDKVSNEICKESYKEDKRKVKMCIYQSKKEVNK